MQIKENNRYEKLDFKRFLLSFCKGVLSELRGI